MANRAVVARWAAGGLAALAALLVLLGLHAAPRTGLSWRGAATELPAARFEGGVALPDGSLEVRRDAGAAQHLLRVVPGQPLHGRFLSYRFEGMPPTLRLALGWRAAADAPWRWVALPFPDGTVTVDLARLSAEWTGHAATLAFSLLPAELVPPSAAPAARLRLLHAELEADARAPAVAAQLDEWRSQRPWTGRSINTGGFDLGYLEPQPFQRFLLWLLAAAALVLLPLLVLPARRRSAMGAAVLLLAGAWLVLDLGQLRTAWQRSARLGELEQAAPGALSVEPRLAQALARTGAHPALAAPGARLVVFAANPFLQSWPVFELLPLDAAALPVDALPRLRRGALVLRLGEAGRYGNGHLASGTHDAPVRELHAEPGLQLLQLLGEPEPVR